MTKPPSILTLIVFLAVLAIFGVVGAKYMLGSHSESTFTRLGIVWPGIETMPEQERAFLFELALTCNVVDRQPVRADVVACLRTAAAGMQPPATDRLDRLVAQAPPASPRP
jgi:hypothetical protein